jgi:hypothetical protein
MTFLTTEWSTELIFERTFRRDLLEAFGITQGDSTDENLLAEAFLRRTTFDPYH